jgi:hypothetical protein
MQSDLHPTLLYNWFIRPTNKGNVMQQTTIYRELEAMIEKGWLVKSPSELDQLLAQLEKDRQITREEYRSLLELYVAKGKKLN